MGRAVDKKIVALISALLLSGCRKDTCVELDAPVPLLEAPYPMGYPSTRPKPNRVLRTVPPGRVQILGRKQTKDFLVYKVKAADGTEGYIVADTSVTECPKTR
jgi:hypothetical protein